MPATYTQAGRPLSVTTPLAPDTLLLIGFSGTESISQLFQYQLTLLAPRDKSPRQRRAWRREERAPPHSITSPAAASTSAGMSSLSAAAVFRLTII